MSTIQEFKNSLLTEGYCVGNLSDVLSSEEIETLRDYYNSKLKGILQRGEKSKYFSYRHNYQPPNGEPQTYANKISIEEAVERDKFCKENNLLIWQRWLESSPPVEDQDFIDIPFNICIKIPKMIYPEYNYDNYGLGRGDVSLFEDEHFICRHNDGENEGRICVILVYLTEEKDYNDGGGELVIETASGKNIEIKPLFGTFCMLDFTKHNIPHEVYPTKNGFKRFTYINFVTLNERNKNVI